MFKHLKNQIKPPATQNVLGLVRESMDARVYYMCSFFCRTLLQSMHSRISRTIIATQCETKFQVNRKANSMEFVFFFKKMANVCVVLAFHLSMTLWSFHRRRFFLLISFFCWHFSFFSLCISARAQFLNLWNFHKHIFIMQFANATQLIAATWYSTTPTNKVAAFNQHKEHYGDFH